MGEGCDKVEIVRHEAARKMRAGPSGNCPFLLDHIKSVSFGVESNSRTFDVAILKNVQFGFECQMAWGGRARYLLLPHWTRTIPNFPLSATFKLDNVALSIYCLFNKLCLIFLLCPY